MSRILVLDSSPLGLLTHPQRTADVIEISDWVSAALRRGSRILVPAIIYYELKRELLRARKESGIRRLDAFTDAVPGRYLPLTDEALRLGAELWARSRQAGRATAHPEAIDIDAMLAAQALSCGVALYNVVVVTTNPKHLSQFVATMHWKEWIS